MPEPLLQISYTLSNIESHADKFWQCLHQYRVFAFSGMMGAGKTTFIHALCEYLNVRDAVSSPTFSLINEYHFLKDGREGVIYHMDWYRLRDETEAIEAGMEDALLQTEAYCFVEWPEKATALLPRPYLWIEIEVISETVREMNVKVIG